MCIRDRPVMPGTAGWQLGVSRADDQFRQGNTPRQSLENHEPVVELARQMAATFSQIAADQRRDPRSSDYSNALYRQSATISTGEGFEDRRVYVDKS